MRETEEVRDDRKFFKSLICEMFNYKRAKKGFWLNFNAYVLL